MRKTLLGSVIFITVIFILYGCSNIPTAPSAIPKDPTGTTKPNTSLYSTDNIYASIDRIPALLPIAIPEYVKVRLSLPGVTEITPSNLRVFEDNKEQGFALYKESTTRNKLDIAIIFDVTGSMERSIDGAKNSIIAFADTLKNSGIDVRIAIIPYDDHVNPPKDINVDPPYLNLSTPDDAKEYVSKLSAGYGGDWWENLYDAIMFAATGVDWRPGSQRSMIIITDAPAHYKDDGTNFAHFTKAEMLPKLVGYFTIHGAFVPKDLYNSPSGDFSAPEDPRELCQKTGGIIKYTDSAGNVDLSDLGIIEYVTSSWIIAFESDSSLQTHTIEIFYEKSSTKKYIKMENVVY